MAGTVPKTGNITKESQTRRSTARKIAAKKTPAKTVTITRNQKDRRQENCEGRRRPKDEVTLHASAGTRLHREDPPKCV